MKKKISKVNEYFEEENTIDSYERVLNYLEGLQMGYKGKNPSAVNIIQKEIDEYRSLDTSTLSKERDGFITFADAIRYSFEDRYVLWRDLFSRNKKWLEKGYIQKEINDFMDVLYSIFKQNNEKLDKSHSMDKLNQLRKEAEGKENTHNFFF